MPIGIAATVLCVPGFVEYYPNRRSICTARQGWVPSIGYCQRVLQEKTTTQSGRCPDQPYFANAVVSPGRGSVGAQRMVVCIEGFKSSGSSIFIISCLPNLQWTNSGNCERTNPAVENSCPEPPVYRNAVVSPGINVIGAQRMVVCNDGYKNSGSSITYIYCLRSLQWSVGGNCERPVTSTTTTSPRPTTTTIPGCPNPPSFQNAQVSHGENQVRSERVVTCNEGFVNGGTSRTVIYCQPNLRWTDPGNCVRSCTLLPMISNGMVSSGFTNPGSRRQIYCSNGYTLVGPSSITCSAIGGHWSTPGRCEPVRCQSLPNVRNGAVSSGTSTLGSNRQIFCHRGYTLEGSNTITCSVNGQWSVPGRCVQGIFSWL